VRKLKNGWLQAYREYATNQESPEEFHFWIALQLIAGALRRSVWVDRNAYTLFPNMFIILVTDSGACRKSVAMDIGLDLLHEVDNVYFIHERTSLEGLMDVMNRTVILDSGKVVPDGSVFIAADELTNLFGKASYITDLMAFLTAAYGKRTRLEFVTRNRGVCTIRNPCPCLLAGTTPEQFGEVFPSSTMASGFLGRIIVVSGKAKTRIAEPSLKHELRENLVHDLRLISKLDGEMKLSPEARIRFKNWYETMPINPAVRTLASFYERKHDHVLKASMLISASTSDDMIITTDHINIAIASLDYIESKLDNALRFIGATEESVLSNQIYRFIRGHHPDSVKHSVVMRKFHRSIKNANAFRDVMDVLLQAKRVVANVPRRGGGITYGMPEGFRDIDKEI